jgi:hypothetical protein
VPLLANRLNYPALIPPELHSRCLFRGDNLLPLLLKHLNGDIHIEETERAALQRNIAQYDWAMMGAIYDAALENLRA